MIEEIKPPIETTADKVQEFLIESFKGQLGPLSPVVGLFFPSHYQEKIKKWFIQVSSALNELRISDSRYTFETLKENEEFFSILIQVIQIASRNHQKEKLNQLKNVICNTPASELPTDIKLTFVQFLNELTVNQVYMLHFLIEHETELKKIPDYQAILNFIINQNQNIKWTNHEFKMYLLGLSSKGLIRMSEAVNDFQDEVFEVSNYVTHGEEKTEKLPNIIVTQVGKDFIKFISDNLPHHATQTNQSPQPTRPRR